MEFQSAHLLIALLVLLFGGVAISEAGNGSSIRKGSALLFALLSGAMIVLPLAHEGYKEARSIPGWTTHKDVVKHQVSLATRDVVMTAGHLVDIEASTPIKAGTHLTFSCPPEGQGEYCKISSAQVKTYWTPEITWLRFAIAVTTSVVLTLFVLYRNGWMPVLQKA